MKILNYLEQKIRDAIKLKYNLEVAFEISRPPEGVFADFAVNAGFVLAKPLGRKPADISAEVASVLKNDTSIESAEAASGYINIALNRDFLKEELYALLTDNNYFRNDYGKGKNVNLEFVSANPVGPLNVVSGRAGAYGDTLANLLAYSGFNVEREFYVNDHGRQMKLFARSLRARYFELHKMEFDFPEDGYKGEYVKDVAAQVDRDRESAFDEIMAAFELKQEHDVDDFFKVYGLEFMKNWQKTTLENFGVRFDRWFSEAELHQKGEVDAALKELKDKGAIFTEEGAQWLDTMKFGDDKNRVIVKQDGEYTYLASDIAYMRNKFNRGNELVVNILGPDHHGYIKRLEAIARWLGKSADQIKIIILQQVNLLEGGEKSKMSKREGKLVTLDELLQSVGTDAARYYFIMRNYNSHLDFDINMAKAQTNDNPVYYVQYAYARVCNILMHAEEKRIFLEDIETRAVDFTKLEKEEKELLLYMFGMPGFIKEAAEKESPSGLVQNVYDLVSRFHSFYAKHRVIAEDKKETEKRLVLMAALKKTLKVCFGIMGITARERM
jgi:arginyl-tRNA synthetase